MSTAIDQMDKDKDISLGDAVAFALPSCSQLHNGVVIKISPKTVRIECERYFGADEYNWNNPLNETEYQRAHKDVVVVK